ncbi:MAG: glycosyltransferase family 2 protein [Bacteroidetes bacterium]|nr:glycosyltransferase family 2 protein [Bacteroidota bacterium]
MENKNSTDISVVIPVYGCSTSLTELYLRLVKTLEPLVNSFEIIMVNDASPDDAWATIVKLSERDKRVKGFDLSRNFGQHYAISAGLTFAKGEWIVVMDCDLQDQPEEIVTLYEKTKEGFDIVVGQRVERKDSFFKRSASKLFYKTFSYLTETKLDHTIANFGIYSRPVIISILRMHDYTRYFPTMVQWVGFKRCKIIVTHKGRAEGKSSYNLKKMFDLALNTIIAFSNKPLRLTVKLGIFTSVISLIVGIIYLYRFLAGDIIVLGYASLIISIWLIGGLTIMVLGIIGLYIGKIFDKVKERPDFIIKDRINADE